MNILSIGNSFSQDAQRYVHEIAKADGVNINSYNLYIGGCTLSTHYRNMKRGTREYSLGVNGVDTGFKVSLKDALLTTNWDVITVQQASHESYDFDKYEPYLSNIVEFVRECVPKAKIVVHQTWAYEDGSKRLNDMGYEKRTDMFNDIKKAYECAAEKIGEDLIIPSGELMEKLTDAGIEKVHRDNFHATLGVGRYALGMLWYAKLTGNSVDANSFCDFDEEVSLKEIEIVKSCVKEIC